MISEKQKTGARLVREEGRRVQRVIRLAGENTRLRMALDLAPTPVLPVEHPQKWFERYERWFMQERRRALERQ